MELWENEVYRFKTIGQLKVGLPDLRWTFIVGMSLFADMLMNCDACLVSSLINITPPPLYFQAISQYLPRGDLRLRPAIYEMILHEFLKTDYEVLHL